jgi:hypothetical protein
VSGPFATEVLTGAFVCSKLNEEGGPKFVFEGAAAVVLCVKKPGMAGLDCGGPLREGMGTGFWLAEVGAEGAEGKEGKENEGAGTGGVVLFSGLSLISLARLSEDDVGNLNNDGVSVGATAGVSAFGGWATENAGVWVT